MTCRSLHYTVSVSSPCWSNPSQPPKGRCNERTGSVSLITVGAEWPGTLDIMRNCVISSASLRVTQLDIMLSACLCASWHPFPLSPYESSAGRGVLLRGHPRPWPVAKPRTLRVPAHKVHGSCLLRHSAPVKEDGLAVAGSLQIIFLVFRSRAGSLQLRQSAAKKLVRSRSFQSLHSRIFSSAHFLRLRSKVSRFAACVYIAAPVDCQAKPVSPLPQHTPLPLVAACPWSLSDFLPSFCKRRQEDR